MRPTLFVSFSLCMMLATGQLHAATDPHPLQPGAPRTVSVSEAETPPQIRAGLLQSTLIVLPVEEKVANVFAGDTVSSASRYNACMARSFIVGIPSGLSFPLDFGI